MVAKEMVRVFAVMGNVMNSALSVWIFYNIFLRDGIGLIEPNETIAIIELVLSAALLFVNLAIAFVVIFRRP